MALDEQQRPIGYATWIKPEHADRLTLTRQAAPFGDHLALQRLLERHIEQSGQVAARHFRSAQQEQEAW